jgi:predicted peptidase
MSDWRASQSLVARPRGSTASAQGYYEYKPPHEGPRPVLVFLHGMGENGDGQGELDRVLVHGPPMLIAQDRWPQDRPFLVLCPQHAGPRCHTAAEIDAFLEHALATYEVDRDRIYLTGLSCGGIGAWSYAGEHLDSRIVAMVPICGDGKPALVRAGSKLRRIAIWAFHGDADDRVTPDRTIEPMRALEQYLGRELRLTIYPGVGHDSWTRTYDGSAGHDIYAWLLGQHR